MYGNGYGATASAEDKLAALVALAERNARSLPAGTLDQVYQIVGRPAQTVTITLRASGDLSRVSGAGSNIEAALGSLARQAGVTIERGSVAVRVS